MSPDDRSVGVLGCFFEPDKGFDGIDLFLSGRKPIESKAFICIYGRADTFLMAYAEAVLCVGMSLACGTAIPFECFVGIGIGPESVLVVPSQVCLRTYVAGLRCLEV